MYQDKVLPNRKNGVYGHGRERYEAVLAVFEESAAHTNDTAWQALEAAAQDPNPQDITSNTQWSLNYNDTDLTVEIVLRRNWQDVLRYDLNDNRFLP